MRSLAYALLLPLALSAPTPEPASSVERSNGNSTQNIQVIWKHHKGSSKKSLVALTEDGSALLGQACSDTLSTGRFSNHKVTLKVDKDGAGELSYGKKTYKVLQKAEHSGGIKCNRIYGPDHASIDCIVPWSGSVDNPSSLDSAKDCFAGVKHDKRYVDIFPKPGHRRNSNVTFERRGEDGYNDTLQRRISPSDPTGCQINQGTILVGDGDPHQNFYDQQISEVESCGAAQSCATAFQETESFTIQFTIGIGKAITEWITGGFAVSEQWTTGNTYTCTGGTGDQVCTWYNTAHTAYTVRNTENDCEQTSASDPFTLWSPNNDNRNGGYYCVIGTCRAKGDAYWDYNGRAGGP